MTKNTRETSSPAPASPEAAPAETAPGTTMTAPKAPEQTGMTSYDPAVFEDAEKGLGFAKEDVAIPFLKLCQALTPERQKTDAKFIPGLEEGMYFNSVTRRIYGTSVTVIPVFYMKHLLEWKPKREGFVKDHGTDRSILSTCRKNEKGKDITPEGNEVVETATYYLLIVDRDSGMFETAAFSLSSTGLKRSRQWNSLMAALKIKRPTDGALLTPAKFFNTYEIGTTVEKNDEGTWYGLNIQYGPKTLDLPGGTGLYSDAREFAKLCESGAVRTVPREEVLEEVVVGTGGEF